MAVKMHLGAWLLLLVRIQLVEPSAEDYWSDTFDEGANCKQEPLISELASKGQQCEETKIGNDSVSSFQVCKSRLHKRLLRLCAATRVSGAGELLYCKKRTDIKCCFSNYSCVDSWNDINTKFEQPAVLFLKDTKATLAQFEKEGYKKCHKIDGYNASICADECEKLKSEEFAKNCSAKGGFFKCCIRRDKINCHTCRFCCVLPLCALNETQGIHNKGEGKLDEGDQAFQLSAIDNFNVLPPMYKGPDYRCLKPEKEKPPGEWPHYVHKDFKTAITEDELAKAKVIPFDVNFFNFEDPEVFKNFTGPEYQKFWKQTYGLDWTQQEKLVAYPSNVTDINLTSLLRHCAKTEFSDFAKKCKADLGYFKCCGMSFGIYVYENLRLSLAQQGLLEKPKEIVCGNMSTDTKCSFALASHICTKKDLLTGLYKTTFETPSEPKFEVGGNELEDPVWSGLRTYNCMFANTCQKHDSPQYFDVTAYEKISDRKTFCEAAETAKDISYGHKTPEKMVDYIKMECPKGKLNSIFMCKNEALLDDIQTKNATAAVREEFKKLSAKKKESGSRKSKKSTKRKGKKHKQKRKSDKNEERRRERKRRI